MDANDFVQYQNLIQNSVAANNAWSAEQAQKQMDFQERMSNTAHQREVADLKAAGLNPILAAQGAGATTPTGSVAEPDRGGTTALMGLLDKLIDSQTAQANATQSIGSMAASHILSAASNSASGIQAPNENAPVKAITVSAKKNQKGSDRSGKQTIIIPVNNSKEVETLSNQMTAEQKSAADRRYTYGTAATTAVAALGAFLAPKVFAPLFAAGKKTIDTVMKAHKYDRRSSVMGVSLDTTKLPVSVRNQYWLR